MAIFLREQRRTALIDNLTKLSMPRAEAENYASFGDDLKRLDKTLSALVRRVGERCERLRETAHDDLRRRQCEAFLQADLCIYGAYTAEVNERHLSALLFPKTTREVASSLRVIDHTKAAILSALGKTGRLQ